MRNLYYCVTKLSNEWIFKVYETRSDLIRQRPPMYKRSYDVGTNTSEMVKNAEKRISARFNHVTGGVYPYHHKKNFQYDRRKTF